MAYFECIIGGGANAKIIVTYDASLYGKTITCSNGIDTYTQTTTSSGVTEFEVDAEGSWTITCYGISRTVEVIFNYNVPLTITKNITVYSAANDTLSFTDASGSKTVTTNSVGAGSVVISYINGGSITFTSTVAKNPNDVTQPYSKQVTLDENTSEVYIMPDGALYWYGNNKESVHDLYNDGVTVNAGYTPRHITPTFNTNSITLYPSGAGDYTIIGLEKDLTEYSSLKCITSNMSGDGGNQGTIALSTTVIRTNDLNVMTAYSNIGYTTNIASLSGNQRVCVFVFNGRNYDISALWLE